MHSLLFVPAKSKMLQKIPELHADCFIIDLEDSIEDSEKSASLEEVKNYLSVFDLDELQIIVRVNKSNAEHEMAALASYKVGFMLPKVDRISDYDFIGRYAEKRTIVALIESPLGLINLDAIASSNYITALAFGAEDFTASIGMTNQSELLQYQKSRLVTYARAYGKKVYDTPSFALSDQGTFEKDVANAKALGFDGKMAISPKHLDYINQMWADADIDTMLSIIQKYESEGKAVSVINGKVYEKMHIAHMKRIVKENGGHF